MSIGSALSNAMSGLDAAAKSAELISSNVSNALTPGYAKRSLELSSRQSAQGGVKIDAVLRQENKVISSERRLADGRNEQSSARSLFLDSMVNLLGELGTSSSLSGDISKLENALLVASGLPSDTIRLKTVFNAAAGLAQKFKKISNGIQQHRLDADNTINGQVKILNTSLNALEKINQQVAAAQSKSINTLGLIDKRNQFLDTVSKILPMKVFHRRKGQIAIYSTAGQMLLDSKAVNISFKPALNISAHSNIENKSLSILHIEGQANSELKLGGGRLAAAFEIRDVLGLEMQSKLDKLALKMSRALQSADIDQSLSANNPGLFTDSGMLATSENLVGLSARLEVNIRVNPDKGGALWRIREGIGAINSKNEGSPDLLIKLAGTFSASTHEDRNSIFDQSSILISDITLLKNDAETSASFNSSFLQDLKLREQSLAVNTDHEMQHLMQVKQAFAANAKVIKAVDDMLSLILKIK